MWALKSPWISTFGICRNLLLYGNISFWLLSSTITTFITVKINTSRLIHDRKWRNCVTTVTMAIWQSPKDNSRYAILKARVHAAMLLVKTKMPGGGYLSSVLIDVSCWLLAPHYSLWDYNLRAGTRKFLSIDWKVYMDTHRLQMSIFDIHASVFSAKNFTA